MTRLLRGFFCEDCLIERFFVKVENVIRLQKEKLMLFSKMSVMAKVPVPDEFRESALIIAHVRSTFARLDINALISHSGHLVYNGARNSFVTTTLTN